MRCTIPESLATSPRSQFPARLKISCTGDGVGDGGGIVPIVVGGALGVLRTVSLSSFGIRWNTDIKFGTVVL